MVIPYVTSVFCDLNLSAFQAFSCRSSCVTQQHISLKHELHDNEHSHQKTRKPGFFSLLREDFVKNKEASNRNKQNNSSKKGLPRVEMPKYLCMLKCTIDIDMLKWNNTTSQLAINFQRNHNTSPSHSFSVSWLKLSSVPLYRLMSWLMVPRWLLAVQSAAGGGAEDSPAIITFDSCCSSSHDQTTITSYM